MKKIKETTKKEISSKKIKKEAKQEVEKKLSEQLHTFIINLGHDVEDISANLKKASKKLAKKISEKILSTNQNAQSAKSKSKNMFKKADANIDIAVNNIEDNTKPVVTKVRKPYVFKKNIVAKNEIVKAKPTTTIDVKPAAKKAVTNKKTVETEAIPASIPTTSGKPKTKS